MDKTRYIRWFNAFCEGYYEQQQEHDRNYRLKQEHTYRVCDNVSRITLSENAPSDLSELAWLCGLFHDLGRFPQYRHYRTFKDSLSINHGVLSSQIIRDSAIAKDLDSAQLNIVSEAVKFHNAYRVPDELSDHDTLFCLRALRDADKIDIWKVFIEYYGAEAIDKPSAVGLGLSEDPFCSEEAIRAVLQERLLSLSDVKTLNDFKLLQLSWVFDLNFKESYRILKERDYLKMYGNSLPSGNDIVSMLNFLESYVSKRS